jgi:hypothetical protein
MSCRENGAENLKCRHHFERCLAISSHKLALSFGCAGKGLSGVGRQCFYLALLIACRAFADVCSIIWSGKEPPRHSGGFHVHSGGATRQYGIRRPVRSNGCRPRKWGWTTKNWPSNHRPGRSGNGSGGSFQVTVERLGGGLAAVYQARGPPDLVAADGNYVLTKRCAAGLRPWFARRFSRVADGRTTTMLRRDCVRYSTPWRPTGVPADRCR